MLPIAARTRILLAALVLAVMLLIGLGRNPLTVPILRLSLRLTKGKIEWTPPLLAVLKHDSPYLSKPAAPLSLWRITKIGPMPPRLLVWLGLADPRIVGDVGPRAHIAVVRPDGIVLRELCEVAPGQRPRCWLSQSGNRAVYGEQALSLFSRERAFYSAQLPSSESEPKVFRLTEDNALAGFHQVLLSSDGKRGVAVSLSSRLTPGSSSGIGRQPGVELEFVSFLQLDAERGYCAVFDQLDPPFPVSYEYATTFERKAASILCDISSDGSRVVYAGVSPGHQSARLRLYQTENHLWRDLTDVQDCEEVCPRFLGQGHAILFMRLLQSHTGLQNACSNQQGAALGIPAQLVSLDLNTGEESMLLAFTASLGLPVGVTPLLPSCWILGGDTDAEVRIVLVGLDLVSLEAPQDSFAAQRGVVILEGSPTAVEIADSFTINGASFCGFLDGRMLMRSGSELWLEPIGSTRAGSGTKVHWSPDCILATTGP